jgi:hypothetical protein
MLKTFFLIEVYKAALKRTMPQLASGIQTSFTAVPTV